MHFGVGSVRIIDVMLFVVVRILLFGMRCFLFSVLMMTLSGMLCLFCFDRFMKHVWEKNDVGCDVEEVVVVSL